MSAQPAQMDESKFLIGEIIDLCTRFLGEARPANIERWSKQSVYELRLTHRAWKEHEAQIAQKGMF